MSSLFCLAVERSNFCSYIFKHSNVSKKSKWMYLLFTNSVHFILKRRLDFLGKLFIGKMYDLLQKYTLRILIVLRYESNCFLSFLRNLLATMKKETIRYFFSIVMISSCSHINFLKFSFREPLLYGWIIADTA